MIIILQVIILLSAHPFIVIDPQDNAKTDGKDGFHCFNSMKSE